MLVVALADHRGPLSASLQAEYGVRLGDPSVGALELADWVQALPPGCAFWRAWGGDMARSVEEQAMLLVEFRLRELMHQNYKVNGGKGGDKPKPITAPPIAGEVKAEQERMSEAQRRFAERFG